MVGIIYFLHRSAHRTAKPALAGAGCLDEAHARRASDWVGRRQIQSAAAAATAKPYRLANSVTEWGDSARLTPESAERM